LLPSLILNSYGGIFLAAGHSGRFAFFIGTSAVLRMSLLFYAAPQFGVSGVIVALLVSEVLLYPVLVAMLWPYKSLDIRHDVIFAFASICLAALVFQINGSAIGHLF